MPRSGHLQIRCRVFAALPISLEVVRDLHALREAVHTRSLNSADVDEHVLATLIRLNKPVALGLVEPFHSPSSHVNSPLRLLRTRLNGAVRLGITPNSQAGHQPFRLVTELPARLRRIHNSPKHRGESR